MADRRMNYNPTYFTNSNPNGNFRENTYTPKFNNFQQAFTQNSPIIEAHDFTNRNNTIHNNLGENLNKEVIKEYTIDIDSLDRNINLYPDPFIYSVVFSNNKTTFGNNTNRDEPHIYKQFKNVKYIRVNNVILPKLYDIIDVQDYPDPLPDPPPEPIWELDPLKNLRNERFVILNFDDLVNNNTYSSNQIMDRRGIKLYCSKYGEGNFYKTKPLSGLSDTYFYKDSQLGIINKINISFYDDTCNKLRISKIDPSITDITDIRNPLNRNLQNNITLTVGVIENELNTRVSFN